MALSRVHNIYIIDKALSVSYSTKLELIEENLYFTYSQYFCGFLTLTHAAKGPKGLSYFEKQTAKHFLKFKNLKIWVFLGNYM